MRHAETMPFRVTGMLRAYYRLTKPGIIYGNLLTVLAGYLFATHLHIDVAVLAALLFGMALVIAGACVSNNVIDRDIDAKMERTKERATVTGQISVRAALVYAALLSVLGYALLFVQVNALTAYIAFAGMFVYIVVYGYVKRVSRTHTLVGSISGAVPILAGYTAYTDHIGEAGIILFLILMLWQMPHFYAIALFRLKEYAAAGIPLLPSEKGAYLTKVVIAAYIAGFVCAASLLTVLGYTGYTYLTLVLGFGIAWFVRSLNGFRAPSDEVWAKELFFFSLKVLLAFCVAISFGSLLR